MDEPAPPPILTSAPSVATPGAPAQAAVDGARARLEGRHYSARPKVWPYLLAPFAAFVAASFASGTAVMIVATLSDPEIWEGDAQGNFKRWSEEHFTKFPVVAALLLSVQLTMLVTTFLFAMLARDRSVRRLGFVPWKGSISTLALTLLGTLGVQFLIEIVAAPLIEEPSESLKLLTRMFLEPQGLAAVGVGFLMSVLPGVCEEALYRGYVQPGLLRRWSPFAAIAVTSIFFAAMHADVQHSIAVLPLGAWFGFVAWRMGSVWPAVLCHFVNNLAAFVVGRLWGDPETFDVPDVPGYYVVGTLLIACSVVAAFKLMRTKTDDDQGLVLPIAR